MNEGAARERKGCLCVLDVLFATHGIVFALFGLFGFVPSVICPASRFCRILIQPLPFFPPTAIVLLFFLFFFSLIK